MKNALVIPIIIVTMTIGNGLTKNKKNMVVKSKTGSIISSFQVQKKITNVLA
jgi:hypothetical protein